jgi:hypothetical protein
MHLLTCLLPCDSNLNSEFAPPHTLASYLSTSTATTGTSFSEAQKDEYTGDFKGEYGLDYWNQRRTAWIAGRPIQSTSNSQSLRKDQGMAVSYRESPIRPETELHEKQARPLQNYVKLWPHPSPKRTTLYGTMVLKPFGRACPTGTS